MKNLNVFRTNKLDIDAKIVGQCIDADNGRLLVLTDQFKIYQVRGDQLAEPKLIDYDINNDEVANINLPVKSTDVILVEFVVESGSVLVVLKTGQLIRIGVSSFGPPSQCVYKHDKFISSVKLSPDQDLITLADQSNDVFILSNDFIIVRQTNALEDNESVHKPVGVGWGSKETQFFGLDGRPSKEKQTKDKIVVEEEELAAAQTIEASDIFLQFREKLKCNTMVDWRGDGQFLATLTYIQDTDKHYLKVWNRNLELQYMSEQLVTMERGLLSWIPNGQYICCAQRRDNRINEIALFEKNGMVHQRLTLPTFMPHLYIDSLLWSLDSKILALIVVKFSVSPENSKVTHRHMIMLYTMQNFHYYLKYSSYLDQEAWHYSLRWNPIYHNILYISSNNGKCVEFNCNTVVDFCHEDSTVTVVDSNKLLITPFDICNIPPPMSAITVELDGLVTQFLPLSASLNSFFVLTSDNRLYYKSENKEQKSEHFKITANIASNERVQKFSENLSGFTYVTFHDASTYQNLMPINETCFITARQVKNNCEIDLHELSEQQLVTRKIQSIIGRQVVAIVKDSYFVGTILLLLDDATCLLLNLLTAETKTKFIVKTASERLFVRETYYVDRFDYVLTLTLDMTLRSNQDIIVPNCCTSFKASENFLIYTTTENMINIRPLDRLVKDELGPWNQPIENGGTLVLVSEKDSKVILQMPRGNLEILHPRIMVLFRIIKYLEACEYLNAMKLARRYRVDLNFLVDYLLGCDEKEFYSTKLDKFAYDVASHDAALLNLLITELNQEDTTQGRYESAMYHLPEKARQSFKNDQSKTSKVKVNEICSSIRLPEEKRFLQPRLLCLLKQQPPKTDKALELIHALPDKDEKEAALKFILYFVHVDQLFLDALSTYNTDIALMVAGVSSKDPKEYLALLDNFNSIDDDNLRKYKMDCHIKKYEKAFSNLLTYLHNSPDKNATKTQLLELMVSKRIYKHAIEACFNQLVDFIQMTSEHCRLETTFNELGKEIWMKYGDYLLEKRYHLEAGLAYLKTINTGTSADVEKKLENVMKCFLLADEWERCVAIIERFNLKSPKKEETLQKISSNLFSQGKLLEGTLVAQLQKDDKCAYQLMRDRKFHLAEALITDANRGKLHDEINQSIRTDLEFLSDDMETEIRKSREYFIRLKELILNPQQATHFDIENCFTSDSLSTVDGSETSSVLSGSQQSRTRTKVARSGASSIKTKTSSKSSKSQASKRKKINLKEGSRYEDMALVIELKNFIENQKSRQEYVRQLLAAQIEFNSSSCPFIQPGIINGLLRERHELAGEILNTLWPRNDSEEDLYSLFKRFSKVLATGESLDNAEIKLLLRPDFPDSLNLIEF